MDLTSCSVSCEYCPCKLTLELKYLPVQQRYLTLKWSSMGLNAKLEGNILHK